MGSAPSLTSRRLSQVVPVACSDMVDGKHSIDFKITVPQTGLVANASTMLPEVKDVTHKHMALDQSTWGRQVTAGNEPANHNNLNVVDLSKGTVFPQTRSDGRVIGTYVMNSNVVPDPEPKKKFDSMDHLLKLSADQPQPPCAKDHSRYLQDLDKELKLIEENPSVFWSDIILARVRSD